MIFVEYGLSKFGAKPYAYKRAHCKQCNAPRLFLQGRWFGWVHLFIVPLIPIGYDSKWICTECQSELKSPKEPGLPLKLCVLPLYFLVWYALMFYGDTDSPPAWLIALRILMSVGLAYFIYTVVFHWRRFAQKEMADALPLDDLTTCAACGGALHETPRLQCQACRLRVIHPSSQTPQPPIKWLGWHGAILRYNGLLSLGCKPDPTRRPKGRKMMIVATIVGAAGAALMAYSSPPGDIFYIVAWIMVLFGVARFGQGIVYYVFES